MFDADTGVSTYHAEPTPARMHLSDAPVRGIMGPIGSGKSVACCLEVLRRAIQQAPGRDKVRRSRWAVIRQTYPELKSTTIQTWQEWIPESICPIVYDSPIRGNMRLPLPDGTRVEALIYFLAVAKPRDAKKLLSLELTGAFINEARELDLEVITAAYSRTGRYPKTDDGAAITWSGLIMDTNPPDDDHWWYKAAEETHPAGWEFFRQPGALLPETDSQGRVTGYRANPDAENVAHQPLGYAYWNRQIAGADPEWINVHCCGEYGSVFDGKPVFGSMYIDALHSSPTPLGLYRGLPILLGWDFGGTPTAIVGQLAPTGQLRILREYVCTRGAIKQFATDVVRPALTNTFLSMPVESWGDPAGNQRSQADDMTCMGMLNALGIPTRPAPGGNAWEPRKQVVMDRLGRMIDGKPALLLDPSCKYLRRGFIGGYQYTRVQVAGEARFRDEPAKNKYSHPHDALQYLILGADGVVERAPVHAPPQPENPWGGLE